MSDHPPTTNKRLVLILGGARSGKSAYAEQLALRMARGHPPIYVATATPSDEEMRARIAEHRRLRDTSDAGWLTIEAPDDPASALAAEQRLREPGVVVLDCLTLLVANLLLGALPSLATDDGNSRDTLDSAAAAAVEERAGRAIDDVLAVYERGARSLIIVSNEVGMGIVPVYPLGRLYRDLLGRLNARIAARADAVLLLVAGLPIEVKSLSHAWNATAADVLGLDS
jgi:adenosylcobinamide kinase/adenosylcobinamide-phosphate guanylyltransferase